MRRRWLIIFVVMCGVMTAAEASAQSLWTSLPEETAIPRLGGEVHLTSAFLLEDGGLCPSGSGCVLGHAAGVGLSIERRWLWGLGFGLGYDLWFMDSAGVYEQGAMQFIHGAVRFFFLPTRKVHPFVSAGLGALLFGDSMRVSTVGAALQLGGGMEWELNPDVAFFSTLGLRLARLQAFTTPSDEVRRGSDAGITVFMSLQIGVSVLVL